ncbi:EF-hand calcium-binding domain-containing protein 11-like [Ciona intestinalis]
MAVSLRRLQTIFDHCDEDKKGFLNRKDLKVAMLILFGYKPSKYEIQQLLDDGEGNEKLMNFETFKSIMAASKHDPDHEIRDIFRMFDTHCRGFLVFDDVKRAFHAVAPHISDATIRACCEEMCRESDGRISYREFAEAMRHAHEHTEHHENYDHFFNSNVCFS